MDSNQSENSKLAASDSMTTLAHLQLDDHRNQMTPNLVDSHSPSASNSEVSYFHYSAYESEESTGVDSKNFDLTLNRSLISKSSSTLQVVEDNTPTLVRLPETKSAIDSASMQNLSPVQHNGKARSSSFSKQDRAETMDRTRSLKSPRSRSATVSSPLKNSSHSNLQDSKISVDVDDESMEEDSVVGNLRVDKSKNDISMRLKIAPEQFYHIPQKSSQTPALNLQSLGHSLIRDVEIVGLPALVSHPITRVYFLLHLVSQRKYGLLFFYIDVQEYRQMFYRSSLSQRHHLAYRLYQTYLAQNSPFQLPELLNSPLDATQLAHSFVSQTLANPSDSTFSDFESMVSATLEDYSASFFKGSAAYQAMRTDYGDVTLFTKHHVERALQRLLDIPTSITQEFNARLFQFLESYKYDLSTYPGYDKYLPLDQENPPVGFMGMSIRNKKKNMSSNSLADSLKNNSSNNDLATLAQNLPQDSPQQRRATREKATTNQPASVVSAAVEQHPFVLINDDASGKFCEYCFKDIVSVSPSPAIGKSAREPVYRCESCHYFCHKSCRNYVTIPCMKMSGGDEDEIIKEDEVKPYDSVVKLLQKYSSLKKEIHLSENIKSGMEKMAKAKDDVHKSIMSIKFKDKKDKTAGANQTGLISQLAQANQKIQFLQTDIEKTKYRLAGLLASPDIQAFLKQSPYFSEIQNSLDDLISGVPLSAAIRVFMSSDQSISPNRTRKSLLIDKNMTAADVIRIALEKDLRRSALNSSETYDLCYEDKYGIDRVMKRKDKPIVVQHIMQECSFFLDKRKNPSSPESKTSNDTHDSLNKPDEDLKKMREKRRAILQEIVETDAKYTENMTNALLCYQVPLTRINQVSKVVIQNIFGNLKELVTTHDSINREMNMRSQEDAFCNGKYMDVYCNNANHLSVLYTRYCSNQHSAQRTLSKIREDPLVNKCLEECQNLPQLAKLGLGDILIQPMHRITRMPLLFKRLLSSTPADHSDYIYIHRAIIEYEQIAASINDIVKKKENDYRIRYLQQNLDWNTVAEAFPIAVEGRELIMEKPFTCLLKKQQTQDVLTFVFNDMCMLVQCHKRKDGQEEFSLFRQPILFTNMAIFTVPHSMEDGSSPRHQFSLLNIDREITTLEAFSNTDKITWIQQVEALAYDYLNIAVSRWHCKLVDVQGLREKISSLQLQGGPKVIYSVISLNSSQTALGYAENNGVDVDSSAPIIPSRSSSKSQLSENVLENNPSPNLSNSFSNGSSNGTMKTLDQGKKTTSLKDLFRNPNGKSSKKLEAGKQSKMKQQ